MLSIIVSSYQKHYFDQFSKNVKETIGENFNYEIIQIWNPGLMGICEAYNKGAEQSKYENLLFVHEDILFETEKWGKILIEYFKNSNIGCIGIAGSSAKTIYPIAWWNMELYKFISINQLDDELDTKEFFRIKKDMPVTLLDGVFIAVTKNVWKEFKFNEEENKSFHGYDIEFSLNVASKYQNYVSNKIILTHFSGGTLSQEWFLQLVRIYRKKKFKFQSIKFETISVEWFLRHLINYPFTKKDKIRIFLQFYNPFNYSIINNVRIIKLLLFYFKSKK